MTITRDQFIRGFNALKDAEAARNAVEGAASQHGFEGFDLGASPLANELERQLVERCRAREDEHGPWPDDSCGEDDISLALHFADIGSITDADGRRIRDFPTTAEGVWAMWERERTGPFRAVKPTDNIIPFNREDR